MRSYWSTFEAPAIPKESFPHLAEDSRYFFLSFFTIYLVLKVPVEQETLTLSFMEEEEEERAPGAFQV